MDLSQQQHLAISRSVLTASHMMAYEIYGLGSSEKHNINPYIYMKHKPVDQRRMDATQTYQRRMNPEEETVYKEK
jgi:hypothetical protein